MPDPEPLLRPAYHAFNARDIDAALELMHPDVDWPNAWEGGRVIGHAALRDYWSHTGELISETTVRHSYQLRDGMITRMDVLEPNEKTPSR
jgi:ketosteroid isomerase-like protein